MKKLTCILLLMLMLFASVNVSAYKPITVEVNAQELAFDVAPINQNGRVLVPVRAIFEALGATVQWNQTNETVTSVLNDTMISLTIDSIFMLINNQPILLDVSPTIISDRAMVPARAVSEAFDATVSWNGENNKVEIFTKEYLLSRAEGTKTHSSSKTLSENGINAATTDFSVSYFDKYDIKTNLSDGTDFEILCSSDSYYAKFSIRTDIYSGAELTMTDEYAQNLADDLASAVHGTPISGKVVSIFNRNYIEARYFGRATSSTMGDVTTNVVYYATTEGNVMYTMTYISYGDVPAEISADMEHMINTLVIH